MKDQFVKAWSNIKDFWSKQPKKVKTLFGFGAVGVILAAIAITVYLNVAAGAFKVLYPGITQDETTRVYVTLKEMGVPTQMNEANEIMVPKDRWDNLVFELAGKGYPKSAPAYNVFSDNVGFTTTEFEKKQYLLFSLQDRIQTTLAMGAGVDSAIVTITVPEDNNYVWQQSADVSTASVMLGLKPNTQFSPEQVTATKNLVSASVPKLKPENVVVIDQNSGMELAPNDADGMVSGMTLKQLDIKQQMEKEIEDKVKRLLNSRYGDGVTVVAAVDLDFSAKKEEVREVLAPDEKNDAMIHYDDSYNVNGATAPGGIVGEENNTDIPEYPNNTGTGDGAVSGFQRSADYENGYSLTQSEKGQAEVKTASMSVIVNESSDTFDEEKRDLLIDIISKSVNVQKSSIWVDNLDFQPPELPPEPLKPDEQDYTMYIIIAAGVMLLMLIVMIVLLVLRARKKKLGEVESESENVIRDLQAEIEQHKREIMESAQASNSKENAITNEVREFARENPEITATLIRSMLKEDD